MQQVLVTKVRADSLRDVRTYDLQIRTTGTEELITSNRTVSRRTVDSVDSATLVEDLTVSYRQAAHWIYGWIYPDSVALELGWCPWDPTTIQYPYDHLYRFYNVSGGDTFDVREDTLVITIDDGCFDLVTRTQYHIVADSGIIRYHNVSYNFFDWSTSMVLELTSTRIVLVGDDRWMPSGFVVLQNYPNPFNPCTTIRYELPARSHVVLKIFNILGEEVATLVDEGKEAGRYEARWEAKGSASGVYFYRLQAGTFVESKKLIIVR